MAKRKVVRETAKWRRLKIKGQGADPHSVMSPKTGFFHHFRILFHSLMQKDQQEKDFWKVFWLH